MPVLTIGDPAPWFIIPSIANQSAHANTIVGGYRTVLFFFGSSQDPQIQPILSNFRAAQSQFEQHTVTFFGVSIDPTDRSLDQSGTTAHFKFLLDFRGDLSAQYGVCQLSENGSISYDPTSFILDENLRVLDVVPLESHIPHVDRVLQAINTLPKPQPPQIIFQIAPVLTIPNVLPPEWCQRLIDLYNADGGTDSGFFKQERDKTVLIVDHTIKRRRDVLLTDPELINQVNALIWRRVKPEIEKAFHFRISNFERYTVACYEEATQGFFQPHRDNRSVGTAHRRFAMTLNLNTGDYEGGCLRFPEYGTDLYCVATGSAIVFSCSLLHEAIPVTKGRRFALLSFFYGNEDAKLREQTKSQIIRDGGKGSETGDRDSQPSDKKPDKQKPDKQSLGFQPKHRKR
ncbi:MAG: redoxin domain-containing protein [Cyanobacteria bacterium CRU_2_1]|nr:redoxin domain-containing protein [Cyanobacteria bacterium RU_5_0]NJR59994.1 redoxin domain-containing protein [Cyanobacteria bacterium CRU_2_1]